jgi:hypothetical protein
MFEHTPKGARDEVRDRERKFATWALKRVSQGEFRENYYKLLKQYEEENDILVKN